MECSICYNEINCATGKVELSCSHPYHLACIARWFDKQRLGGSSENCPLCRNQASEYERMPSGIQEEDAEYDGFFDWTNIIDYPPASLVPLELDGEEWLNHIAPPSPVSSSEESEQHIAMQRTRSRFDQIRATSSEEYIQIYAATLIKACWRGYQDRLLYKRLEENKDDIDYSIKAIKKKQMVVELLQQKLLVAYQRKKFLNSITGLPRTQVKATAATRIQAFWRASMVRILFKTGPVADLELKGLWRKTGASRWEKIIMNPEEDMPACIMTHPLSTLV
jgi:hypothetical protein